MSILEKIFHNNHFAATGITSADLPQEVTDRLRRWVNQGHHGQMSYIERSVDSRADLSRIYADVRSVIVTLTPIKRVTAHVPTIAAFAHNFADYHIEIKNRLHLFLKDLQQCDPSIKGRAIVDSAPAFERALAVRAGLGWIGRNSMLIHPTLGSYTLIGLLLINKELPIDNSVIKNRCPEVCTLCRDACPNSAINDDCSIDARRCISYLTCENSPLGEYPNHNHILGCDRCTDVCPYNRDVQSIEPIISVDWETITQEQFNEQFRKTSFERVGLLKIRDILALEPDAEQ